MQYEGTPCGRARNGGRQQASSNGPARIDDRQSSSADPLTSRSPLECTPVPPFDAVLECSGPCAARPRNGLHFVHACGPEPSGSRQTDQRRAGLGLEGLDKAEKDHNLGRVARKGADTNRKGSKLPGKGGNGRTIARRTGKGGETKATLRPTSDFLLNLTHFDITQNGLLKIIPACTHLSGRQGSTGRRISQVAVAGQPTPSTCGGLGNQTRHNKSQQQQGMQRGEGEENSIPQAQRSGCASDTGGRLPRIRPPTPQPFGHQLPTGPCPCPFRLSNGLELAPKQASDRPKLPNPACQRPGRRGEPGE